MFWSGDYLDHTDLWSKKVVLERWVLHFGAVPQNGHRSKIFRPQWRGLNKLEHLRANLRSSKWVLRPMNLLCLYLVVTVLYLVDTVLYMVDARE